jgi:hypothetical protein
MALCSLQLCFSDIASILGNISGFLERHRLGYILPLFFSFKSDAFHALEVKGEN